MWSFGHQSLRLPRDFFHRYSLQEFCALTDRYYEEQDFWQARHYAQRHNINRGKDGKALDPQELGRARRKPRTKAEILRSLVSPNAMKSLSMFAQAHNSYVEKAGRSVGRTPKKRGAR